MKAFVVSIVALAIITWGANFGLTNFAGFSSAEQTSRGQSVRLGDD